MSILRYHKNLVQLQKNLALHLDNVHILHNRLSINGIVFEQVQRTELYKKNLHGMGILITDLSIEEQRFCDSQRISYLTLKKKFKLYQKDFSLTFEVLRKERLKKQRLVHNITVARLPPATLLISPNGFKILDVLFRMEEVELNKFHSALSLAKAFDLNQPKLSKIMRFFKAHSLSDAKKSIQYLPDIWWKTSFNAKETNKGLTKFFNVAQPHYSLLKENSNTIYKDLMEYSQKRNLILGPLEMVKQLGFLRDEGISIWGNSEDLHQLKNKFKLIPGVNKEKSIWHLATPKYDVSKEALITNLNYSSLHNSKYRNKENPFRAAWDLSEGTERLKELQLLTLKELIK